MTNAPLTIQAAPKVAKTPSDKAPRVKKEMNLTEVLQERHRSEIVSFNADGTVTVKPKAQKLAGIQPVQASLLPLAFPYRCTAGCEGVLYPNASGSGHVFQPSVKDTRFISLREKRAPKTTTPAVNE